MDPIVKVSDNTINEKLRDSTYKELLKKYKDKESIHAVP